jgi:hypothetical protein
MDVVAQIKAAVQNGLRDESGHPLGIDIAPPMEPKEIDYIERKLGVPLPQELRDFLEFTSGIEFKLAKKSRAFTIISELGVDKIEVGFFPEFFTHGLPFAHDGAGNYWVMEITPSATDTVPVYYASHDPPTILYQSPSLSAFFEELFRLYSPPHASLIRSVFDDDLFDVYRKNPGVLSHAEALASSDPMIREFAATLPDHFQIVDLREVPIGMGISHGRYGYNTELKRHGEECIFAYAKPPRRGLMARLFGVR